MMRTRDLRQHVLVESAPDEIAALIDAAHFGPGHPFDRQLTSLPKRELIQAGRRKKEGCWAALSDEVLAARGEGEHQHDDTDRDPSRDEVMPHRAKLGSVTTNATRRTNNSAIIFGGWTSWLARWGHWWGVGGRWGIGKEDVGAGRSFTWGRIRWRG